MPGMKYLLDVGLVLLACRFAGAQQDNQQVSAEYTEDDAFREASLNVTNTYRRQHNATSVEWNNTLADIAREWSERCVFEHSGGPTGENLASGYPNVSASVIAWGHERVDYDFGAGEFSKETGHFTQLVWKETTSMGCGRTECNGRDDGGAPGWYYVCEYWPHGNVIGHFQENVQEQVPEDQQPEGPSDPQVPDNNEEECPQGAVCGGGTSVRSASLLSLVVGVAAVVLLSG